MARTSDSTFRHGRFLVDSSGLDSTLRPKYDYILQEMGKADGVSVHSAELRTGTDGRWLVVNSECFEFAFQFKSKYFNTLVALMQADGIPLSNQLKFLGSKCNTVEHKHFADTDVEWVMNSEAGVALPRALDGSMDDDEWVDVGEELRTRYESENDVSMDARVASLHQDLKLAYLKLVRETCEKKRIPCNIAEAYVETPQIVLLRAIWQEQLPQVLSLYRSLKDSDDAIPLHDAVLESVQSQRLKLVDFFLEEGATFTYTGFEDTIIWSRQSPELYDLLFRRDWHEIRTNGTFLDQCLKQACSGNRPDMVQYLMRKGARPKVVTWIADTSTIVLAARSKEMLEYVLFKGEREPADGLYNPDATAKTLNGSGALHAAALHGAVDIVRALLRWGADVNDVPRFDMVGDPRECDNGPALHKVLGTMSQQFASGEAQERHDREMEKYFDMIALLLENGADPTITDERRRTAWDLADRMSGRNQARTVEILQPFRPGQEDERAKSEL